MAYEKKTWVDRDAENLGGRKLTDNNTSVVQNVTVELDEGEVYEEGTPLNAGTFNDLERRIEEGINEAGGTTVEVTPIITDGESIATITVDGVSTTIKATDYSNALILDVTSVGV